MHNLICWTDDLITGLCLQAWMAWRWLDMMEITGNSLCIFCGVLTSHVKWCVAEDCTQHHQRRCKWCHTLNWPKPCLIGSAPRHWVTNSSWLNLFPPESVQWRNQFSLHGVVKKEKKAHTELRAVASCMRDRNLHLQRYRPTLHCALVDTSRCHDGFQQDFWCPAVRSSWRNPGVPLPYNDTTPHHHHAPDILSC